MKPLEKSQITQSMTLHLNGGKAFSAYTYDVKVDGVKVGNRSLRYEGRPRKRVLDVVESLDGSPELDMTTAKHEEVLDWITKQHMKNKGVSNAE